MCGQHEKTLCRNKGFLVFGGGGGNRTHLARNQQYVYRQTPLIQGVFYLFIYYWLRSFVPQFVPNLTKVFPSILKSTNARNKPLSANAPQIFREEGVIGTSSIKCQAFLRVLFTLRSKQCKLFYCQPISRFVRNKLDAASYELLPHKNGTVYCMPHLS